MRQEQFERIRELTEALADRFIAEADPSHWTAPGKLPPDMTQQERGDAYWCKKNAMATGGVLRFALELESRATSPDGGGGEDPDADLDRKIDEAEKRAKAAVSRAMDRAKSVPRPG